MKKTPIELDLTEEEKSLVSQFQQENGIATFDEALKSAILSFCRGCKDTTPKKICPECKDTSAA